MIGCPLSALGGLELLRLTRHYPIRCFVSLIRLPAVASWKAIVFEFVAWKDAEVHYFDILFYLWDPCKGDFVIPCPSLIVTN